MRFKPAGSDQSPPPVAPPSSPPVAPPSLAAEPPSAPETGQGIFPLTPAVDLDEAPVPLLPLESSGAQDRWVSRRDAARGLNAASEFAGRRVDVPLNDDNEEMESESRRAIEAIEAGLASADCSEIHGNGPDQLFVKFRGGFARLDFHFASERDYNTWIREQVETAEAVIGWDEIVERRRGIFQRADGASMTVVLPPFAPAQSFSIRKHTIAHWDGQKLVDNGTMTPNMLSFLNAAVAARANILIVGEMGSGKSSTLSILSHSFSPSERVAVIEEIPEIHIAQPQVTYFTYQPMQENLGLGEILDSSLYMRFDRVIVGEVHLEGITKMLEVWMTGSDGSLSTYHSDSAERAIERMKLALQLENPNMTAETALGLIRQAVDLVVVLDRVGGRHRCLEIVEIDWRESSGALKIGQNRLFSFNRKDQVHEAANKPDAQGKVFRKFEKYSIPISPDWFAGQIPHGMNITRR